MRDYQAGQTDDAKLFPQSQEKKERNWSPMADTKERRKLVPFQEIENRPSSEQEEKYT